MYGGGGQEGVTHKDYRRYTGGAHLPELLWGGGGAIDRQFSHSHVSTPQPGANCGAWGAGKLGGEGGAVRSGDLTLHYISFSRGFPTKLLKSSCCPPGGSTSTSHACLWGLSSMPAGASFQALSRFFHRKTSTPHAVERSYKDVGLLGYH